jgi:Kdo2-lipid IVA lauroyltransferase/acyltransferase
MPRQIGPVRARIEYAALASLLAPMRALERERAVRFGARLGALAMHVDRFDRGVAMRNLKIAFPALDKTARLKLLRAAYENWGRSIAEWMHFDELGPDSIGRFASYRGIENWRRAEEMSAGRGALILTAHFGNWEFLIVAHSVYGHRVAVVVRPIRNPLIDAVINAKRTLFGNRVLPRKGAGREALRLLRENWIIGVPLDLDVRHGAFVDFFSLKACTADSLARLAIATGVPVVPVFIVRDGTTTHHWLEVMEPLEAVRQGSYEESVRLNTQRYTSIIESMVRRYPDHWNWIHRRWKTRPPGETRFY